jgi:MOSC domain-containing protein YiiM
VTLPPTPRIDGLFAGAGQHRSGIAKLARQRVAVGSAGLAGDLQVDRRYHGGPDRAVHHFPGEHYALLRGRFPGATPRLLRGALGENLSTLGWNEQNVAIGDVFASGSVVLQVTQPRSPCWKINARLDEPEASRWMATAGATGWYYRVLHPGELVVGDAWSRVESAREGVTLQRFWQVTQEHRPALDELDMLAALPALALDWQRRLRERIHWRRNQVGGQVSNGNQYRSPTD